MADLGENIAPAVPATGDTLPSLTVPQLLAFAAFVGLVLLILLPDRVVSSGEFVQLRKLAVFLIGALLPSDALIRFGRSLFMRGIEGGTAETTAEDPVAEMRKTTLPQLLAFGAFVVVLALALVSNEIVTNSEFVELNDVAVFLIAALLPSDAAIRFGRSLYLRSASRVTPAHLKRI